MAVSWAAVNGRALLISIFLLIPCGALAQDLSKSYSDLKGSNPEDFADGWAKKNTEGTPSKTDSYWPSDAFLDLTVGKNTTPVMSKILARIKNRLESQYQNRKGGACKAAALYAGYEYVNDRTRIFADPAFKKFGLNFIKKIVTLPGSTIKDATGAGSKAAADKVKDYLKKQAKKGGKKLLDEVRKKVQGQPPEVYSQNGSWTSVVAARCTISMRVIWNKKSGTYQYLIVASCPCECDARTGDEKRQLDKIKTLLMVGSGKVAIRVTGKAISFVPNSPSMAMKYQCCGDDKKTERTYRVGGSAAPKPKKGKGITKYEPTPEELAEIKKLKEMVQRDPKKELKSGVTKGFSDKVKKANDAASLDKVYEELINRIHGLDTQIQHLKKLERTRKSNFDKNNKDPKKKFKRGKTLDAAEKLKKELDDVLEKELGPKVEKLSQNTLWSPEEQDLLASFQPKGLLYCPRDAWLTFPPETEPKETVLVDRQPIFFESIVRRRKECVGTLYIHSSVEGFRETITTIVEDPKIVMVPPEETPTPEEGDPEDEETPPEQPSEPVTSTPPPQTPEKPESPKETGQPEELETPDPDLGLVKATVTVVDLALSGESGGDGLEGAVVKLLPPAPDLPGTKSDIELASLLEEDATEAGKATDPDAHLRDDAYYQSDVASGLADAKGRVAIAAEFSRPTAIEPDSLENALLESGFLEEYEQEEPAKTDGAEPELIDALDARKPDSKTPNGWPSAIRSKLALAPVMKKPLVVALDAETEKPDVQLATLLQKADQPEAPLARRFTIGQTPVYVVMVDIKSWQQVRDMLISSENVVFVEEDPCRNKEQQPAAKIKDPHYQGAGLWGQKFDNQWAIKRVGFDEDAKSAWGLENPNNAEREITIAIIDTGIDWYHPDLPQSALWKNKGEIAGNGKDDDGNGYVDDMIGWDFVRNTNKPWDHDGHGTFVAGVIAAARNNDKGIAGINPDAKIMVLKALDALGQGHASMISQAIVYAVDNGAQLINLSLGGRGLTKLEQMAVAYAKEKGVLLVVAAGNAGAAAADYAPAGLDGVVTVAATDRNDKRAGFSNWGPAVDIAAPGVDVLSLRARDTDLLAHIPDVRYRPGAAIVGKNRAYLRASGTSFAAPIVTGTLSLILQRNPSLTSDQARRMVLNAARDIDRVGIDNFTGYGLLDAKAALHADPDYYVESRISGIQLSEQQGQQILNVMGVADANQFENARLLIGRGEEPTKWLRVRKPVPQSRSNTSLMALPAALFRSQRIWILRLDVKHQDGTIRQARFKLTLG